MSSIKKIVMLGVFGVGKTSLTRRFVDNSFSEDYLVTIGVQIKKKTIKNKNNEDVSLIIWDIEGTQNIQDIRESYILGAHALVYVIDTTRIETYQNLAESLEFLKSRQIPIKVLANKADIGNIDAVRLFLEGYHLKADYYTSAFSGKNVDKVFKELANQLTL